MDSFNLELSQKMKEKYQNFGISSQIIHNIKQLMRFDVSVVGYNDR